jgi:hypothetical protein
MNFIFKMLDGMLTLRNLRPAVLPRALPPTLA